MKQIPLLKANDIDVKIKKVDSDGVQILLYKTSRVDMAILDEVFGAENWQDDYKEIKGNLYCGIGTRENKNDEFIWKWDCGIESREDEEGNQKKGEASDAFKRAGFKVGIGRELYTAPKFMKIKCPVEKNSKGKLEPAKGYRYFNVKEIKYNERREITKVIISTLNGEIVYPENKGGNCNKWINVNEAIKGTSLTLKTVDEWILKKFGQAVKINDLSEEQYGLLMESIKKAKENAKE